MKRKLCLLMALGLVLLLCGCSKADQGNVVNVYNWGEYLDMSILDEFEEQTGITVNYKTFESNEQMYSVLKNGGASYDVIIPSDYMISRMIEEDMLEKLDFSNIPNFDLVSDQYKNLSYDPTNEYSVPYMWGTLGLIYNSAYIDEEITSWSALWDERYSGNILMFNNNRDAMGVALKYLGYSLNTTDEQQLREAEALLSRQKPLLQKYVMDQIYDLLESGEALIGPYYAGDYLCMIENNPDLVFVIPEEGSNWYVDSMCIPKGAEHKENAEAFINFMCSTDICVRNMYETGYVSPNEEANDQVRGEYDLTDPDDAYQHSVMFPEAQVLDRCEVYINLPAATNKLYSRLWIKLLS